MLSRQHENRRYQKRTHETEILTFRRIDALHSPNFATNSSLDILLLGEVTRYAILKLGHLRLRVDGPFLTWPEQQNCSFATGGVSKRRL